jgi:hypothetical protein
MSHPADIISKTKGVHEDPVEFLTKAIRKKNYYGIPRTE